MNNEITNKYKTAPEHSELGKQSSYEDAYNPNRLYPIPRAGKRLEIGINPERIPFYGFDIWNHYEVSWLNEKGKPIVAIAEIIYDCSSEFIIESKSMKLYFNSLNNTKFKSLMEVQALVKKDLEACLQTEVLVKIVPVGEESAIDLQQSFAGVNIDNLDIECKDYMINPETLKTSTQLVEETLYSDLLKSNCLVTGQPDWGSVQIQYKGRKIDHGGLLKYLVSFRNHNEFHEQCIERIFVDIMNYCKPEELTVYGRYTRRGGLDINPYRSSKKVSLQNLNMRLVRQ